MTESSKDYVKIEKEGRYVAQIVKVEDYHSPTHPNRLPSLRFVFRLLEAPYTGAFAGRFLSAAWQPDSPTDKWFRLFGFNSSVDTMLTTEMIKEKVLWTIWNVNVLLVPDKKNTGRVFANVDSIEPMKKSDYLNIEANELVKLKKYNNLPTDISQQVATPKSEPLTVVNTPTVETKPKAMPPQVSHISQPNKPTSFGDEIPF